MKILSMTATFGKLEHETITFGPGLNVIHAPNEWGKSTWCAFICAMLYGIDTRERSKQGVLADKERYAPWSGSPMSGTMEILWNDKKITLQRSTKGRTPFGEFLAYETDTGLPVPELTAANCGQVLLGVEKSVFTRSAFIRQTDLPVAEDEALRRRLNALVTTGDETGASDDLAQKLKALKNRCRHNKTGLLPQAEAQRTQLEQTLTQITRLHTQAEEIQNRQAALEREIDDLQNHEAALSYAESQADAARVAAAWDAADLAQQELDAKRAECAAFPDREDAQNRILHLEQLLLDREALDQQTLPTMPEKPAPPPCFAGLSPLEALDRASKDKALAESLSAKVSSLGAICGALSLCAGIVAGLLFHWLCLLPAVLIAALLFVLYFRKKAANADQLQALHGKYPGLSPEQWVPTAKDYAEREQQYLAELSQYEAQLRTLEAKKEDFNRTVNQFTDGLSIHEQLNRLRNILTQQDALQRAEEGLTAAKNHAQTLAGMVKTPVPPTREDLLTFSPQETAARLLRARTDHRQLKLQQGQVMGQMETLGGAEGLQQQLTAVNARIQKLEAIYSATVLAMETLSEASDQLQRKFAPRISQQAQTFFHAMTGGRYDRLILDQELTLHTAATEETQLRPDLWRSDGTMDQLYLSLRLAVAKELTPDAPLVLDDAFVRFDDTRLAAAMEILKDRAREGQILLFTCQNRENALM